VLTWTQGITLFFTFPFAACCWNYICPSWQIPTVTITGNNALIMGFIDSLRRAINQHFSLEIIALVYWAIWITMNDFILKGIPPSIY
jgi:hypothetical protein